MKSPTIVLLAASIGCGAAFSNTRPPFAVVRSPRGILFSTAADAQSTTTSDAGSQTQQLADTVSKLKRVLTQEYLSFFNPMVDSWYKKDVTFDDPLTSLSGVDSYRNNVDMLAGRTLLGKLLFDGAGINLHSVTGGEITGENGSVAIGDVVTRWTLRMTLKVLPWKPEAVFSGISVYKLQPGGKEGVTIVGQTDYWDSINIKEGMDPSVPQTQYQKVAKSEAVADFLGQLKPGGFQAAAAAPELPYLLLRRGDGYEVRKYPGFVGIETPYMRRDFGFEGLGAFANGLDPLAPSLMQVYNDDDDAEPKDKMMTWPLRFTNPGEGSDAPAPPPAAEEKAGKGQWKSVSLATRPERIVAVRTFTDAAMGPVVRNADRELRAMLKRDGLAPKDGSEDYVVFAQYDAVHSMGTRRSEAWIELKDGGHPF
ncbi:hypothetical protein ACHAXT_012243 [Thalassiosira profunda]